MIRIGVIGYGYWGPNVVPEFPYARIFGSCSGLRQESQVRGAVAESPSSHAFTTDAKEVLKSPDIDVVAIVTPVWTHFELAKAALENGKACFCREALHLQRRRRQRN